MLVFFAVSVLPVHPQDELDEAPGEEVSEPAKKPAAPAIKKPVKKTVKKKKVKKKEPAAPSEYKFKMDPTPAYKFDKNANPIIKKEKTKKISSKKKTPAGDSPAPAKKILQPSNNMSKFNQQPENTEPADDEGGE